eukprot:403358816
METSQKASTQGTIDRNHGDEETKFLEEAKKFDKAVKPHPHLFIDMNYHAPAPDEALIQANRFILVRHGVTEFNKVFSDIVGDFGFESEQFKLMKVDDRYIDIELRPEGVKQCEVAQEHANKIKVRYIMVSQMVRACQTAIHIFKNHPDKEDIKFLVIPLVKEGLNCSNDKCGTYERMRSILDPLIKETGVHFDWSLMHTFGVPDLIQIKVTTQLERLQEMYEYINPDIERCTDTGYTKHFLKISYDKFPYRMEGPYEMYERGLQFRIFLKHFMSQLHLEDDDKIAIVSHSSFLASLSSKGFNHQTKQLIEPAHMYNCEFVPWQTFELEDAPQH